MAKLGEEQVMVAEGMVRKGASTRQVARQLGVTEWALRYRLRKRQAGPQVDGRSRQASGTDGFEEPIQAILERLEDGRLVGEGRPAEARQVYELLTRDYGFTGCYRTVVRHPRRPFSVAPVRALRRVETPPGVQAQHDWFEALTRIRGVREVLSFLVEVLSHSRGRFSWVSREANQLAWHTGHLALFERYGGVPLWVRIDKNDFSTQHYILDDLMHALRADAAVPPARLKAKRYFTSAVLVIDEVGFRPLDRLEANLFFRLVSARYERGSIVLTTNNHVRDWPETFAGDEILTTAILDRLLHHVHILHIDGRSYRLREPDGMLQALPPGHPHPPGKEDIRPN
jgi:hypothetical protein